VADAVFPAQTEPYANGSGKPRKVGAEDYKNRILAFIESRVKSDSSHAILGASLDHIAARLDAVYEKACKAVHANVTQPEARLTVIETYLLVSEVAQLWAAEPAGPQAEATSPRPNP
jgi:hypothetical protein